MIQGWLTDWRIRTSFNTDVELQRFIMTFAILKTEWFQIQKQPDPSVECCGSGFLADNLNSNPEQKNCNFNQEKAGYSSTKVSIFLVKEYLKHVSVVTCASQGSWSPASPPHRHPCQGPCSPRVVSEPCSIYRHFWQISIALSISLKQSSLPRT